MRQQQCPKHSSCDWQLSSKKRPGEQARPIGSRYFLAYLNRQRVANQADGRKRLRTLPVKVSLEMRKFYEELELILNGLATSGRHARQ